MTSLIAACGLSVDLSGRRVLSDVSLDIAAGEILTIVGPNGSGKTTLLRALLGAIRPQAGTVYRQPGLRLGYVPQTLAIDRSMPMTVGRFLALGGRFTPAERAAVLDRVGLSGREGHQLADLSGGQFQRALLAGAILGKPQLLVLDEAAQGLDQPATAAFYRLIADLRAGLGCAVLMVSHDLHVVMSASDRVICLNGHVCCEGTPHVVSAAPEYRALFGLGTQGAFALYQHAHDHTHAHAHDPWHDHDRGHEHGHGHEQGHEHGHGHGHSRDHAHHDAPGTPPDHGHHDGTRADHQPARRDQPERVP